LFAPLPAGDAVGPRRRVWMAAIPICPLVDVRVSAEMETQALGVPRWLGWG
jgi:hypothetical protein